MDADFVKIKQNNLTLYIRKSFLSSDLGQALLAGEETLRKRYPLKTLWPSEFSQVCKFNILLEGVNRDILQLGSTHDGRQVAVLLRRGQDSRYNPNELEKIG